MNICGGPGESGYLEPTAWNKHNSDERERHAPDCEIPSSEIEGDFS